jgi:Zn-dependent alcohol dehydrogenase
MDVKAAVAFEAGKPLEIATVKLDGPKAGEVLVEIKATGICYGRIHSLRRRSRRLVPGDSRP